MSSVAALIPKLMWPTFFEEPVMLMAFVLLGRAVEVPFCPVSVVYAINNMPFILYAMHQHFAWSSSVLISVMPLGSNPGAVRHYLS